MFYCNQCAKDKNWPVTIFKSLGKCEICKSIKEYNDKQSKFLPSKYGNGDY